MKMRLLFRQQRERVFYSAHAADESKAQLSFPLIECVCKQMVGEEAVLARCRLALAHGRCCVCAVLCACRVQCAVLCSARGLPCRQDISSLRTSTYVCILCV